MSEDNKYKAIIQMYSHGFKVIPKDPRVGLACVRLLNDWVVRTDKRVENAQGEMVTVSVPSQVYGVEFATTKHYWFHKGQFSALQTELKAVQLDHEDLKVEYIKTYTPDSVKLKLKPGRVLRDYQEDAKAFAMADIPEGDHFSKLIGMPVGTGKEQPNNTPVLTPSGWINIGDITPGQEVISIEGKPTKVKGVYPQGLKPVWKITFEDGRSTKAGYDHLWSVYSEDWVINKQRTKTTGELADILSKQDIELAIPLAEPTKEAFELGTQPVNAFNVGVRLAIADSFRCVPDIHMEAPTEQKISLLRGLLASTGGVRYVDGYPFTNLSDQYEIFFQSEKDELLDDVVELFRSIGGIARKTVRFGKPIVLAKYAKCTELFDENSYNAHKAKQAEMFFADLKLRIISIEPVGYEECTCIEVEHPSRLYVCENYIVTHNTVTICGTIAENSERAVVCVLPKYLSKWQIDLQANLDISPKQIMPVEKTSQLKGLIHIAKEQGSKKLPPLIVLTMTTIRAFIDDYEADPVGCVQDYGCAPWELWKFIGAGVVGIDEAHEHLYSVFKIAMFLHGPRFIALSGTMRTEDDFQEKVQQTIFPRFKRYLEVKMEKYIDVEFIGYHFTRDLLWKIQYKAFGRPEYSHAVLEKSIIRYARLLNGYIEMVTQILDWDYLKRKQNGDKAIIYVATVDMADKFILALTTRYPDLKVNRYCAAQGDKYEDLLASDISVSTLQSSGTAVDIPGLICNVCTTMVNSSKANIQVLGRLRKLGDKKVTLYMPFCKDIPTHFKYTQFRYELFADITKSIKTFNYGKRLGE